MLRDEGCVYCVVISWRGVGSRRGEEFVFRDRFVWFEGGWFVRFFWVIEGIMRDPLASTRN